MGMLHKYVKRSFDHVSRYDQMRKMEVQGADGDLVRCTRLFISERLVRLVVDSHLCEAVGVETGVPQRSPVSSILFAAYLREIFKEMEEEVEEYMTTSFADDFRWLVTVDLVAQLCERLEKAVEKAVK